jgi:NAD(P)-dependent dehydrogenase (short-subunit alcohol dehydrogenase family)
VTGATSGLGEAIVTQLAEGGARVLVGARNAERGEAAAARIGSRVPDADLVLAPADLSLMTQVRSLAYDVMDTLRRASTA